MATVNKQELARKLDVSIPTLSAWMAKWPDFPVEERGSNGRDYRFDAPAVLAFLHDKRDEQLAARAEKDEQLAQLVFPGMEPDPAEAIPPGLSIKDHRELLQIRRLQRQERELNRELVPAAELRALLLDAFATLNSRIHMAIRAAGREQNLSAATVSAIAARVVEAQRGAVADLQAQLSDPHAAEPFQLHC